ncbi:MAG: hypothetical protein M1825_005355 [Sarcosagium campestre]|nr:MAG: hypothetical protein M1825_005355 [Sarcosagium campestre]
MSEALLVHRKPVGKSRRQSVSEGFHEFEKRIEKSLLILWDDLPSWQQDNHYIRSGYRPESRSFRKSLGSLLYVSNEFVNIHSHLLGAVAFAVSGAIVLGELRIRYPTASQSDVIAFGSFFVGAVTCLGMSATYHAISNHSPEISSFGNKLDYVGIVFLITGSFVASLFYGFYCHRHLQDLYWSMIALLGLGCATVSVIPRFRTPSWRPYRAGMFVALGLSAVVPILHGLQIFGFKQLNKQISLYWLIIEGVLYIAGAGLYAARIPERLSPGMFDIWGSSHQIFHFLVLFAASSHLIGLLKAFDYNHGPESTKC